MRFVSYLAILSLTIGTNTTLADENISETLIGTPVTTPAWSEEPV